MGEELTRPRVVIAGGGIAGLEALLAIRDLSGGAARITLLSPEPELVYRPLLVREPFGPEPADRVSLPEACAELGARFLGAAASSIDTGARRLLAADGSELPYEAAVICTGGRLEPAFRNAATLWTSAEHVSIEKLIGEPGEAGRINFVVPPGIVWALPLYEVALLTASKLRARGFGEVALQIVTPEETPLGIFGRRASEEVAALLEACGIAFSGETWVSEDERGAMTSGGRHADLSGRVVALPLIRGRALPGLPADEEGFIPVDEHSRVQGLEGVYAAGDGTNFPIKQGGLATQQADAAAEHIALLHGMRDEARPFHPVLRGKLLTSEESLHMRTAVTGGGGEGEVSPDYLWWPPHKVSGRYLAPWLAGETVHEEPEPPVRPLEVEVALPVQWHRDPMALDRLPARDPD
jgi:sulfide:quinone oxidoreductase